MDIGAGAENVSLRNVGLPNPGVDTENFDEIINNEEEQPEGAVQGPAPTVTTGPGVNPAIPAAPQGT
jgi:hypothetical protein